MTVPKTGLDLYRQAGVDVEAGDQLVDWLKQDEIKPSTNLGEVVSGIGGFAAMFRPRLSGIKDPLLVASTDGVGTKVLLGIESGRLTGLGLDLVAMCVNDLYTLGARPLFFLDYYATGALDQEQFKAVLGGIKQGVAQCGAALLGGETAEMPGLYGKGHFDLAGFVVGMVDGTKTLGPQRVKVGDQVIAFASSGFHSNGYSLVRHWLRDRPVTSDLLEKLLTPTRIYHQVPALLEELGTENIHAMAHITGGGLSGNIPRVLPANTCCQIKRSLLRTPEWMHEFIVSNGSEPLAQEAVFNLGAGMVAMVAREGAGDVLHAATRLGLDPFVLGEIAPHQGEAAVRYL